MFYQKDNQMSFADNYVERRIRKNTFFKQINMLIDWTEIDKEIHFGYQVPDDVTLLKSFVKNRKVKNRIQHKAYKNRPLTEWQKKYNRLISKKRWVVERTFGGM